MSLRAWRDIDSQRRCFGVTVSRYAVSVYLGRRLYRCAWAPWTA